MDQTVPVVASPVLAVTGGFGAGPTAWSLTGVAAAPDVAVTLITTWTGTVVQLRPA